MSNQTELTVRVHHEDDGSLWAEVRELPGCFASGDSMDELLVALREALSLYLTDQPGGAATNGVELGDRPIQVDELKVLV